MTPKAKVTLDDMSEQDVAMALFFATHRHLQPDYTTMAAIAQRLNHRVGPRTHSGLEHKLRRFTTLGKLIVEEVGGPAQAIKLGATASSEREIARLKKDDLLPRDWVAKKKTNKPKLYDQEDAADEATTLTSPRVPSKRRRTEDPCTPPPAPQAKKPRISTVTKPVVNKPMVNKPAINKPTVTKPVVTKPAVTKPTVTKPTVTKPAVTKSAVKKPAATKHPVKDIATMQTRDTQEADIMQKLEAITANKEMTTWEKINARNAIWQEATGAKHVPYRHLWAHFDPAAQANGMTEATAQAVTTEQKIREERQKKQKEFDKQIIDLWKTLVFAKERAREPRPNDLKLPDALEIVRNFWLDVGREMPIAGPNESNNFTHLFALPEIISTALSHMHPTEPYYLPEAAINEIIDECMALLHPHKKRLDCIKELNKLKEQESKRPFRGIAREMHERYCQEAARKIDECTGACVSWEDGEQVLYNEAVIQKCREHAAKLAYQSDYYNEHKQQNPRAMVPFNRYHVLKLHDPVGEEPKSKGKKKTNARAEVDVEPVTEDEDESDDEDEDESDDEDGDEGESEGDWEADTRTEATTAAVDKLASAQADTQDDVEGDHRIAVSTQQQFEGFSNQAEAAAPHQASDEAEDHADSTMQQAPDDNEAEDMVITGIQPPGHIHNGSEVIDSDIEANPRMIDDVDPIHYKLRRGLLNGGLEAKVVGQPEAVDPEAGATTQQEPEHAERQAESEAGSEGSIEVVPQPFDFIDVESEPLHLRNEQAQDDENLEGPGLAEEMNDDEDNEHGDDVIDEGDVMDMDDEY
ncbi:MAG: hypothetical protein Q9208_006417 [Pyrenodesmia sp. 3 TL-2023]